MTHTHTMPTRDRKSIIRILSVLALTAVMGSAVVNPAMADPRHDRGWDRHAHDAGRWHHAHPRYVPGYVEAPPVVYAPPQPSPGINLVLPINFH